MAFLNPNQCTKNTESKKLTLSFSDALSPIILAEFFNSKRKKAADPMGYIQPRSSEQLFELSRCGQIVTVVDQRFKIQALCVAYPFEVQDDEQRYSVTEIGTVINCIKGIGLSELTIAAMAQKIKNTQADQKIVAKVAPHNLAANFFFHEKMEWDKVTQPSIISAYYSSDMGNTARNSKHSDLKSWYSYGENAFQKDNEKLKNILDETENSTTIQFDI